MVKGKIKRSVLCHLVSRRKNNESALQEGLDEEKRDLIERLVRTIGGNTYRIPHLVRIKQRDALEFQANGAK